MKILLTGGAGYIGSFMTKMLLDRGDDVTVFDNLERGHLNALDKRATFIKGDLKNISDLESVFANNIFDSAIHFAGLIAVGESEKNPDLYFQNNVVGSKNFFETAIKKGRVKKFIFSSSAAVYGNPTIIPIPEDHPKNPTSNYGKNKLEVEQILSKLRYDFKEVSFTILRYFNASGDALDGLLGENHVPETHIIPNIIKAIVNNQTFKLYGSDYKTKDGTCIRDYIHVLDLAHAHMLALDNMNNSSGEFIYNVGTGAGYSNKEIIYMVEKVSGKNVKIEKVDRRLGDPDELIADSTKIKTELGFVAKYSDLETIIKTAWKWHSKK